MENNFYTIDRFPDYEDNGTFSKTVILYNETGDYSILGYYDFEMAEWVVFDDFSTDLACWCYIPNAVDFIKSNDKLKTAIHRGYVK